MNKKTVHILPGTVHRHASYRELSTDMLHIIYSKFRELSTDMGTALRHASYNIFYVQGTVHRHGNCPQTWLLIEYINVIIAIKTIFNVYHLIFFAHEYERTVQRHEY